MDIPEDTRSLVKYCSVCSYKDPALGQSRFDLAEFLFIYISKERKEFLSRVELSRGGKKGNKKASIFRTKPVKNFHIGVTAVECK